MKKTHLAGIIIIAVAIAAIMSTIADSSTYVDFLQAAKYPDKEYHVIGTLSKEKETVYNPEEDPNIFSFYLIDNKGIEKKVLFNGTKPQDFERSEQVVLTGKMKGDYFIASKILMKCPSKYNDGKEEVEIKAITTSSV